MNKHSATVLVVDDEQEIVRVILRRVVQPPNGAAPCYQAGPLSVDFARRRVQLNGQEVALTPTEYNLLTILLSEEVRVLVQSFAPLHHLTARYALDDGAWRKEKKMISHNTLTDNCVPVYQAGLFQERSAS
jgi:hypothetical protein